MELTTTLVVVQRVTRLADGIRRVVIPQINVPPRELRGRLHGHIVLVRLTVGIILVLVRAIARVKIIVQLAAQVLPVHVREHTQIQAVRVSNVRPVQQSVDKQKTVGVTVPALT